MTKGYGYDQEENERMRRDLQLMENLVQELRQELRNKRPMTANGASNDWEDEKIEMEVNIQKSQARISTKFCSSSPRQVQRQTVRSPSA